MKLIFEVVRNRISSTQGSATVMCNGQELIRFGDTIDVNKQSKQWESVISDAEFIAAAIFPTELVKQAYPVERVIRIEQKIKSILGVDEK